MLILPSEKKIDWNHPPYILFILVFLNIVIYFFYQSGDQERLEEAFGMYERYGFVEFEAPLYKSYLKEQGDHFENEINDPGNDNDVESVIQEILFDHNFYIYLSNNKDTLIPAEKLDIWEDSRLLIDKKMQSASYLAFGLVPDSLNPVTLFSHQFLHGSFLHLLGNLIFLVICGFAVEAALGHMRFLLFYLIGGLLGGLMFSGVQLYVGRGDMPLVGASGAISAVMAMYLTIFQLRKIEFFYWVFIFIGYFRAPALMILPFFIGKEIFSYFMDGGSNVAFMAHAGGFLGGAGLVGLTLLKKPDAINQEYVETDQAIDPFSEKMDKFYRQMASYQFGPALKNLDKIIDEFGELNQLLFLRFSLLGIDGGKEWQLAAIKVLTDKSKIITDIRMQESAWLKSDDDIRSQLSEDQLVQLFFRLIEIESVEICDAIANSLLEKNSDNPMLQKILGKLSDLHRKKKNFEKHKRYTQMAESLSAGGVL